MADLDETMLEAAAEQARRDIDRAYGDAEPTAALRWLMKDLDLPVLQQRWLLLDGTDDWRAVPCVRERGPGDDPT
jgi:hypothetical protein